MLEATDLGPVYLQYNAMQFNAISIYNARVISWKAESEARAVAMEKDGEWRVQEKARSVPNNKELQQHRSRNVAAYIQLGLR